MNKNPKLLIVDDEPDAIELARSILSSEKYSIEEAVGGEKALEIIHQKQTDIVLLDILMPDKTGYEVCREIKKIYGERPIEVILVSGLTEDTYLEQALEAGGDDFIIKPIVAIELQRRVKAAHIRLKGRMKLYNSVEVLEEVVAEQEDQNLNLKKENENIKKINTELKSSNKELKIKANYDMLSGLLNRMSLFSTIDIEIERAVRASSPLTGVMLDVDHFKQINDNFGHQIGDMVITAIGNKLKNCMRKYDYAGRYGGEEFFMILTNASLQQGFIIGERFRRDLEKNPIQCADKQIRATVSMGIAQYRLGESRNAWIERADKAMYKAKRLGRNRIVLE
ncbi:MAG: diguanylate cyclase [Spirochaetales bacterium]|nr:diguanylate cyclase [Spirochaetales bacterium]